MVQITGNLWEYYERGKWICITTNGYVRKDGKLVMGRGCAKEARDRIPGIDERLGMLIRHYGNVPFELPHWKIISFPVKHYYRDKADIKLIEDSAIKVKRIVTTYELKKIIIPRPGCGYGHLSWEEVGPVLEPILKDDRFHIISFPDEGG